jgi:hypothetical protein
MNIRRMGLKSQASQEKEQQSYDSASIEWLGGSVKPNLPLSERFNHYSEERIYGSVGRDNPVQPDSEMEVKSDKQNGAAKLGEVPHSRLRRGHTNCQGEYPPESRDQHADDGPSSNPTFHGLTSVLASMVRQTRPPAGVVISNWFSWWAGAIQGNRAAASSINRWQAHPL